MLWHMAELHSFSMAERYIVHCMYMPTWFIHSSVDGQLGCFYFLVIANNAAMKTDVQVVCLSHCFQFFGAHASELN